MFIKKKWQNLCEVLMVLVAQERRELILTNNNGKKRYTPKQSFQDATGQASKIL